MPILKETSIIGLFGFVINPVLIDAQHSGLSSASVIDLNHFEFLANPCEIFNCSRNLIFASLHLVHDDSWGVNCFLLSEPVHVHPINLVPKIEILGVGVVSIDFLKKL